MKNVTLIKALFFPIKSFLPYKQILSVMLFFFDFLTSMTTETTHITRGLFKLSALFKFLQ